MRLLLVRHGQTASNLSHALDTAMPGAPLTDHGRRQAAQLVRELGHETFGAIAAMPGLRECDAGDLELQSGADAVAAYRAVMRSWDEGDLDAHLPGARTGRQLLGAFDEAVAALEARNSGALVVTHAGISRSWVCTRAVNADRDLILNNPLPNAGWAVVERAWRGRWRVVKWPTGQHAMSAGRGPTVPVRPTTLDP